MKQILILTLFSFILVSCGETAKDDASNENTNTDNTFELPAKVERIDSFLTTISADDSEVIELDSLEIRDNKGALIQDNEIVELYGESETDTLLLISSEDVGYNTYAEVKTSGGKLKVYIKNPQRSGFYQIRVVYPKSNATGFFFLNVVPGAITELGDISGERFEDENDNQEIDGDEKYSVLADNTATFFKVGPIVDSDGNLVESGFIEWGFSDGNILSSNPASISGGFANIVLQSTIANTLTNLSAVYVEKNGFDDINDNGIQDEGEEDIFESQNIAVNKEIKTVLPDLRLECVDCTVINDEVDLGKVYLTQTESTTLNLINRGSTKVTNLFYNLTPPFKGVEGTPFQCSQYGDPTQYCVCRGSRTLEPQESCRIQIDYTAASRNYSEGRLSITSSGSIIGNSTEIEINAEGVKKPDLEFSVASVNFGAVSVGDTERIELYVQNHGDVPAINFRATNPPANEGQPLTFYNFVIPVADAVIDPDPNVISNCGPTIPPAGKKCRVYIDFTPTARIDDEQLFGFVLADDADSRLLIVRGSSFVNNYEPTMPVVSEKNSILADALENTVINIGPLMDVFGEPVKDVYLEVLANGGFLYGNTYFEDPVNGYYRLKTDNEGKASITLKAKERNEIKVVDVTVYTKDVNGNRLSEGTTSVALNGINLTMGDTIDFGSAELNATITRNVTLFNYGTIQAENISYIKEGQRFVITDEGTCVGFNTGTLSLGANQECTFEMQFTAAEETAETGRLSLSSSSFGLAGSSLLKGSGLVRAALSSITIFEKANLLPGQAFNGVVVLANDGGEDVTNLVATASAQASAFLFSTDCETIAAGSSCDLAFTYAPSQVDGDITNITISFQGQGSLGATDKVDIDLSFGYSSLTYNETPSTLTKNVCSDVWSFKTTLNNDDATAVSPVLIDLYATVAGKFYSDDQCTTEITKIQVAAGNIVSSKFYFKPTEEGLLKMQPIAKKVLTEGIEDVLEISIFGDPHHLLLISGDNQTDTVNQTLLTDLVVKVVDRNNLALRNIPVTFEVTQGGGAVSESTVATDNVGEAKVSFNTGSQQGLNIIKASAATIGSPSEVFFNILVRDKWLVSPLAFSTKKPVLWDFDAKGEKMVQMMAFDHDAQENRYEIKFSLDQGSTTGDFNNTFIKVGTEGSSLLADASKWYKYSPVVKLLNNNKIFIAYQEMEESQIRVKGVYGQFTLAGNIQLSTSNSSTVGDYNNSISRKNDGIHRSDIQVEEFNNRIFVSSLNSSDQVEVFVSSNNGTSFSSARLLRTSSGDPIEVNTGLPYKMVIANSLDDSKTERLCIVHTRKNIMTNKLMVNCTEDIDSVGTGIWSIESAIDDTDGSNKNILLGYGVNNPRNNVAFVYSNSVDQKAKITTMDLFTQATITRNASFYLSPHKVSFYQGLSETGKNSNALGYGFKKFLNKITWYQDDKMLVAMNYLSPANEQRAEAYLHKITDVNNMHTSKISIPLLDNNGKSSDETQFMKLQSGDTLLSYKDFFGDIQYNENQGHMLMRKVEGDYINPLTLIKGKLGHLYVTANGASIDGVEIDNVISQNALKEDSLNNFVDTNFRFENGVLYLKGGMEYDFRNLTILHGAKVMIDRPLTPSWTKLFVEGTFLNYGDIRAFNANTDGSVTEVAEVIDGENVSYTIPSYSVGGDGGNVVYYRSCREKYNFTGEISDGLLTIDVDGQDVGQAPFNVYCRARIGANAIRSYYYVNGGARTYRTSDHTSCKDRNFDLFAPRDSSEYEDGRVAAQNLGYSNLGPLGIYKASGGGSATGLGFHSSGMGTRGWTSINGHNSFWASNASYSEPNGDYTAYCWLSINYDGSGRVQTNWNDAGCTYSYTSYLCQAKDN